MKNFKDMTNFEINLEVGKLKLDYEKLELTPPIGTDTLLWDDGRIWRVFDPCNSWTDAGPIIQENGICLDAEIDSIGEGLSFSAWLSGMWAASSPFCDLDFQDKNPLRAAMIVFLMMKGE